MLIIRIVTGVAALLTASSVTACYTQTGTAYKDGCDALQRLTTAVNQRNQADLDAAWADVQTAIEPLDEDDKLRQDAQMIEYQGRIDGMMALSVIDEDCPS